MNEWIYLEKLIWFLCRYDLLCHVIITLYFIYRIMGVRLMQNKLDLMVLMVHIQKGLHSYPNITNILEFLGTLLLVTNQSHWTNFKIFKLRFLVCHRGLIITTQVSISLDQRCLCDGEQHYRFLLLLSTICIKQFLNFSTCFSKCSDLVLSLTLSLISLSAYSFILCSRCFRFARDRREASLFLFLSSRYLPDSYSNTSSSSVNLLFFVEEKVLLDVEEQEMFLFLAGMVRSFFFTVVVTRLENSPSLSSSFLTVTGDMVSYTKSSNIFFCLIRFGRMVAICFGLFTAVFALLPMLLLSDRGFFGSSKGKRDLPEGLMGWGFWFCLPKSRVRAGSWEAYESAGSSPCLSNSNKTGFLSWKWRKRDH